MTTITTAAIDTLRIGDYLMTYDEEGDGEAMTYDEQEYDDLERRALAHVQRSLPRGWVASTESDCDGVYLVARCRETGATVHSSAQLRRNCLTTTRQQKP